MMKLKDSIIIVLLVLTATLGVLNYLDKPKFGYVESYKVMEQFEGYKEGYSEFQKRHTRRQQTLDSLKVIVESRAQLFQSEGKNWTEKRRQEELAGIQVMENQYYTLSKRMVEEEEKDDAQLTQGVVQQIDDFLKKYGRDHGYTMIMGTAASGSLVYGDEAIDLTSEVIKELNNHYKGI